MLHETPLKLLALAALLLCGTRVALLTQPLSPDEAGFLTVAGQWDGPGTSLYGQYWVDRPPLLVTLYRIAWDLGGAVPLRLLGIVAAAGCLAAVAYAVRRLAGRDAAALATVTAAAFLANPLIGAREVNGELLAAPFIAVGLAALLRALADPRPSRVALAGGLAGLTGAAAMLIKQNMADVFVMLAAVTLLRLVAAQRGRDPAGRRAAGALVGGALLGATAAAGLIISAAVLRGTSLSGVWFAMYQFRLDAAQVIAAAPTSESVVRAQVMVPATLVSGLAAGIVLLLLTLRRPGPAAGHSLGLANAKLALLLVLVFDVASVVLGGSFWSHYLVQLGVPVSLGVGLAAPARPRGAHAVAGLAVVSAILATTVTATFATPSTDGDTIGSSIAAAAEPGDTVVALSGHANVNYASGLPSPYPYLWTLPRRTLDPRYAQLATLLRSDRAPTWLVSDSAHLVRTADLVKRRYRPVMRCPGGTVYLRRDVPHRPTAACAPQQP